MKKYVILCIDANPGVHRELQRDLHRLKAFFEFESATSIAQARTICSGFPGEDRELCLVLSDSLLPDGLAVDYFVELTECESTHDARKMLLTANTNAEELISAVNESRLDFVMAKPWNSEELLATAVDQITTYIISHEPSFIQFCSVLDASRITKAYVDKRISSYTSSVLDFSAESGQQIREKLIQKLYDHFETVPEEDVFRHYSQNHTMTVEGQTNDFLWFVAHGEVIHEKRTPQGTNRIVMREGDGALVGMMSLIGQDKSYFTSYTAGKAGVIKLNKQQLNRVIERDSEFLPLFTNVLMRNLNKRLKQSYETELKLADTLEYLEAAQSKLVESEKMAMLGQLVAGVAHELNNPVSAILRGTEYLKNQVPGLIFEQPKHANLKPLASQILDAATHLPPLSTSEIRKRVRQISDVVGSHGLARKIVELQLDEPRLFKRYLAPLGENLKSAVDYLEPFFHTGTFLRNTEVCSERISGLVKSLKNYSRQDQQELLRVDLHEGLEDTLMIFSNRLKDYEVIRNYGELPKVECYPGEVNQIWTNMISNAIDATDGKGRIIISTKLMESAVGEVVEVTFEDNGPGIPKALQQKIFELNFTTKREGHFGLGIGLAVCQQIVNRHHGRLSVKSETGKFTRFIVELPVETIIE